jgi:hypothetical protein
VDSVTNPVTLEKHRGNPKRSTSSQIHQHFKSSLDKFRVYGGGPLYIKVGARVVYDRLDLDTWLIGKKVANTSQQIAVAS